VIACAWATSEVPSDPAGILPVNDPAHCADQTLEVSAPAVIVRVTSLTIRQPITGDAFDYTYAPSHPLDLVPRFVVSNQGSTTLRTGDYSWRYGLRGLTFGSDAGFGAGGSGRLTMFAP